MAKTVSLTLPLTRADLADLQVGDEVLLSGPVYTCLLYTSRCV